MNAAIPDEHESEDADTDVEDDNVTFISGRNSRYYESYDETNAFPRAFHWPWNGYPLFRVLTDWCRWITRLFIRCFLSLLNITWLFLPVICCGIAVFAPEYLTAAIQYTYPLPRSKVVNDDTLPKQDRLATQKLLEESLNLKLHLIREELSAVKESLLDQHKILHGLQDFQRSMQSWRTEMQESIRLIDKDSKSKAFVHVMETKIAQLEDAQHQSHAAVTALAGFLELDLESLGRTQKGPKMTWRESDFVKSIREDIRVQFATNVGHKVKDSSVLSDNDEKLLPKNLETFIRNTIHAVDKEKLGVIDYAAIASGARVLYQLEDLHKHYIGTFERIWRTIGWISAYNSENMYKLTSKPVARSSWMSIRDYMTQYTTPLWLSTQNNRPETALAETMELGSCYAISGHQGTLTVRLRQRIIPLSVTLHHIHKQVAPDFSVAPRDFEILGLFIDHTSNIQTISFGNYSYSSSGSSKQTFELSTSQNHSSLVDAVMLRILSNHGNSEYTCLYRFQVHGYPVSA